MTRGDYIAKRVAVTDTGCWQWLLAKSSGGYGLGTINCKRVLPHRIAYHCFKEPIPEGMHIDHLCGNAGCCNPDHLEAVSPSENRRRQTQRRTHCPHGHPFSGDNLRLTARQRKCRTCERLSNQKRRAKRV